MELQLRNAKKQVIIGIELWEDRRYVDMELYLDLEHYSRTLLELDDKYARESGKPGEFITEFVELHGIRQWYNDVLEKGPEPRELTAQGIRNFEKINFEYVLNHIRKLMLDIAIKYDLNYNED